MTFLFYVISLLVWLHQIKENSLDFFENVKTVISRTRNCLNLMFYYEFLYLRIPKKHWLLTGMSSNHEKLLFWNASIWVQWPCCRWRLTEISAWYTFHHNVLTSDPLFNSKQRTEQPFYGQFGQMTSPGLIAFYVQVLLSLKRYHSIHYWIAFKAYFQER